MTRFRCPICGKYVSDVEAILNGLDEIVAITGICKTHGVVNVKDNNDWWYEDFIR